MNTATPAAPATVDAYIAGLSEPEQTFASAHIDWLAGRRLNKPTYNARIDVIRQMEIELDIDRLKEAAK